MIDAGGMAMLLQSDPVATGRGGNPGDLFLSILPYVGVLVAIAVIGGIIIMLILRWSRNDDGAGRIGFSLEDLRQLRDQGEITDEEFERARAEIVASIRRLKESAAAASQKSENKPAKKS